jgi:hypothetical protein
MQIMKKSQKTSALGEKPISRGKNDTDSKQSAETGGPKGPEPTRFGDWERKGKCVDF